MAEDEAVAIFINFEELEGQLFVDQIFFGFAGADVGTRNEAT